MSYIQAANGKLNGSTPNPKSAPELDDLELPYEVSVETVDGAIWVIPGVLDDDARHAFLNGQCVAFATAVAEHYSAAGISVCVNTEDDTIIHALAEYNGELLDVDGPTTEEDFLDVHGLTDGEYRWEWWPTHEAEARAVLHGTLPAQNLAVAKTTINPWLEAGFGA